jgi:pimeloyl-ACP methyl ester carboxylesterase
VVAHSMGGAVGLLLAEKIPEKIGSFCNVEGNLIGEDCTLSRKAARMPYPDFEKAFSQMKQEMKDKDKLSELLYTWLCKSDPYGFYYSAKSLVEWSDSKKLLDLFLTLNMRKVYVYGDKNTGAPVLDVIKKVKTVPILNSGHFMMVENPQAFYCALLAFLEDGPL